ncbi:MAG: cell surface protein SprA [Bacteroidales bacterium]
MERFSKYFLRFIFLTFVVSIGWGIPFSMGTSAGKLEAGHMLQPPDSIPPDSTKLIFPFTDDENPYTEPPDNGLYLTDPSNVKTDVQYNPLSNEYEFTRKIGNINYRNPASLPFGEYQDYDMNRSLKSYWRDRSKTSSGISRNGIIPQIHIGGQVFDRIFGSNTIDIRPQGSAELTFGVTSNRRDDPALDVRQRRNTNFDFQEKIQMSVMAKIGDKIEFNTNYNTEATFDFENKLKLKYEGKEDEIIKLIEAGDVTLPLNSTLITGSQSLFGIKTQLQFGRTTITSVFSQQKSQVQNITVQGGAQTEKFSFKALDYEENKHFFLAQYFRDHYDEALRKLPIVSSNINITKIEVWVTNIGAAVTENRNIVSFMDLGEYNPYNPNILQVPGNFYPSNNSNSLLYTLDTTQARNITDVFRYLTGPEKGYTPGKDFEIVNNARKLNPTEYSFNSKLGFISLNTSLNTDQVLSVAYQYTVIGQDSIYQVGEFSDQGITTPNCLMVKLLKSTALSTRIPLWKLMMKNVYSIGAYQVNREDFILNILYSGGDNAVPTGFLSVGPEDVKGVPLIRVMNFDNLDPQLNPPHDGMFDFIDNAAREGGTIQASNGRIFFTVLEPFGNYLRGKLGDQALADRYCFDSLYSMTKSGAQQYPVKNKFVIEGQYKASSGSEISLNALNVPQGSVRVTAGGVPLTEGVEYTVDYTLGRVRIINEGILNSGTPINISLENNSMFNIQTQTLMGAHVEYKFNKDFSIGGTLLNLHERPLTQKVNFGDEPISNVMWGLNLNYQTESRLLTKLIDLLPFISTKTPSKIKVDAEFAHFIPGHSRAVGKTGTSYIDDFEGSKSTIDLKNPGSWFLASTPQGQTTRSMFPEGAPNSGLKYGYNRARLAWFVIDPLFYERTSNLKPANVLKDELSKNSVRYIRETEVFPNIDPPNGQPVNIPVFNLAYYPEERGPYNYDMADGSSGYSSGIDINGKLTSPNTRWGGIMRKIETTDFEATNVEYIEFWMMDPFSENSDNTGGELYFNLGDVSEDILRDGAKSYENGLPTSELSKSELIKVVDSTEWGYIPKIQALTYSFANSAAEQQYQDVGYDGLSTSNEKNFSTMREFLQDLFDKRGATSIAYLTALQDPSADDYHYFRGTDFDNDQLYGSILERYKRFNGPDGNSIPTELDAESYPTQATTIPNVEDLNRDNTLSQSERYFQYKVELKPDRMKVGENYITDIREAKDIPLENGTKGSVKWYQFKIPVQSPEKIVGTIEDFKSIRFMRMFMKGFSQPTICRFATLDLVRGEWRKYYNSLLSDGEYIPDPNQNLTSFDISSVSIEENGSRSPVPYVLPPDIEREINSGTTNYQRLNEQAMSLDVCNLMDGDARGTYKTTDFDFTQYKKLKMYVHAENSLSDKNYDKGDLTVFVRFGSDFTQNYYEYEIPLSFTPWNTPSSDPVAIWPDGNRLEIELSKLVDAKKQRNEELGKSGSNVSYTTPYPVNDGENRITVVGIPSLSDVKAFMIGIRNPKKRTISDKDDGKDKCAEIWVNELRLSDFNEKSGWAATARVSTNLADLGNVVLSGSHSTPGFGSIEKKINERQKEELTQFDVATNLELGKFFPEKSGIRIPLHVDYSRQSSKPQYNPLDPDIILNDQLASLSKGQRDSLLNKTQDLTTRRNINFMNVRKEKVGGSSKTHPWDIENFDVSYAFTEIFHRNIDIESDRKRNYKGGLGYTFVTNPSVIRPFDKVKLFQKSKSLQLLRDFNFYYIPKMFSFRTDMNREYDERLLRNKSDALIIIEPTYVKHWDWSRIFDLKYDLSQSLKLDYSAIANAYVYEPSGRISKTDEDYQQKKDTIWNEIMSFGTLSRFTQQMNLNYNVPLNKIPILNWVTATAKYGSTYRWEASPRSIKSIMANTIENSNTKQINAGARLTTLYNKVGFLQKISQELTKSQSRNTPGPPGKKKADPRAELDKKAEEATAKSDTTDINKKPKKNYAKIIGYNFVGILMGIKDVNITYNETNGTLLPGFRPESGALGNNWAENAPGLGFIFGSQKDIMDKAQENGWLSTDTLLNTAFATRQTKNLTLRSNIEPIKNLKIELTADRTESYNYQAYFKANSEGRFNPPSNPQERGSFSMSYIMWNTAFVKDNADNINPTFENMKAYRITIAQRLAAANDNPYSDGTDSLNYPLGYGSSSQDVLIPAFLAAYSGKKPDKVNLSAFPKIPLPNWRITYNGLSEIKALKPFFTSINLSHAYRSTYSVGSYVNNIKYNDNDPYQTALDQAGNYISKNRIDGLSISEQFSPFIGLDVTMKNSFLGKLEYKRSRNISLSFVNNQLTEVASNEFVIGGGYRIKNVKLAVRSMGGGGKKQQLKSDLNLKLDFSIKDNRTVLRRLDEEINQISTGFRQIAIKFTADYVVNQTLNLRLFFDKSINKPYISSQFYTSATNGGLTLRFTLSQ